MRPRRIAILTLVFLAAAGCVGMPPSAMQVAEECTRSEMQLSGKVRGTPRSYSESARARCEDDAEHWTLASDTFTRGQGSVRKEATYDAREGDKRIGVATDTTVGRGFKSKTAVAGENKRVRWGWDVTVEVRR